MQQTGIPQSLVKWVLDVLKGQDDAHVLKWELRTGFRTVNQKPSLYWAENCYSKSIKSNLGGGVYLDHLISLSINSRELSWLHTPGRGVKIKYFSHSTE